MEAAVWAFIGAMLGATASIVATLISTRNTARLQAEADSLQRREQARAFQRENLLTLQEALQDLARMAGHIHLEDMIAFRTGRAWGRTLLSTEVDEGFAAADRRFCALVERVADDDLRLELQKYRLRILDAIRAPSADEAETLLNEAFSGTNRVIAQLGEELRSQY